MNIMRLTKDQVEEAIANLDHTLPRGEARAEALMKEVVARFGSTVFAEDGASAFERWTRAGHFHTDV